MPHALCSMRTSGASTFFITLADNFSFLYMAGKIIRYSLWLVAFVHLLLGLWWVVISALVVLFFIWFFTTKWRPVRVVLDIFLVRFHLKLLVIYVCLVLSRVLFFEIIGVASTSMQDTIKPGDKIYVSRLRYGPRLPSNPYEITWFNIVLYSIERDKADFKKKVWERRRLKGYSMPKVNDLVVYADPAMGDYFIKRCMGTPGDTLEIRDGVVYINSAAVPEPVTLVKGDGPGYKWNIYPSRRLTGWDMDNWGPYVLPYKGMEVVLDSASLAIYSRVLTDHEGFYPRRPISGAGSDSEAGSEIYTFTRNYYFYIGDNRARSNDSRFRGPVPEIYIIGKARRIILNSDKSIPFFSRFLVPMNRKKYFRD